MIGVLVQLARTIADLCFLKSLLDQCVHAAIAVPQILTLSHLGCIGSQNLGYIWSGYHSLLRSHYLSWIGYDHLGCYGSDYLGLTGSD